MSVTTANSPTFGASMLEALNSARKDAGQEPLCPEVPGLDWETFGDLKVTMRPENYAVEGQQKTLTDAIGEVKFEGRPRSVRTTILASAPNGVRIYTAVGNRVFKYDPKNPQYLNVKVSWVEKKKNVLVPKTRETDKDNVDIIFLFASGQFVQMQASVVTRTGKFWVTLQEVYRGQIVRTLRQKAEDEGLNFRDLPQGKVGTVIPSTSPHAGPHGDWFQTMKPSAELFRVAEQTSAFTALGQVEAAEWEPLYGGVSEEEAKNGWESATISYFNFVAGFGHAIAKNPDGNTEAVFFRFPAIRNEDGSEPLARGEFPKFDKEQPVRLKCRLNNRNNLEATIIVPCDAEDLPGEVD